MTNSGSPEEYLSPERQHALLAHTYLMQALTCAEQQDPDHVRAKAIMDDPELFATFQERTRQEGQDAEIAMWIMDLVDKEPAIHRAHAREFDANALLLAPALNYTGLGMRGPYALEIRDIAAFSSTIAVVEVDHDAKQQELVARQLSDIMHDLVERLNHQVLAENVHVIEDLFQDDIPPWLTREGLGAAIHSPINLADTLKHMDKLFPKLLAFGVDQSALRPLKLLPIAAQEGAVTAWALLGELATWDVYTVVEELEAQDFEQIFLVLDHIKSKPTGTFLQEACHLLIEIVTEACQIIDSEHTTAQPEGDQTEPDEREYDPQEHIDMLTQVRDVLLAVSPKTSQ
jgi:hypothetical protein